MKTLKQFNFVMIVLTTFIMISCENSNSDVHNYPKPDTLMPPYTDTGAERFVFRKNGRLVIAEDKLYRTRSIGMFIGNLDSTNRVFFVEGIYNSKERFERVSISLSGIEDTGIYYLKESTETNDNQGRYTYGAITYTTRDDYPGYVHLKKIDTVKGIISGTFAFKAKQFWLGDDTVSITDGWFDATYVP